jgi:hypothetical protein
MKIFEPLGTLPADASWANDFRIVVVAQANRRRASSVHAILSMIGSPVECFLMSQLEWALAAVSDAT